MYQVVSDYLDLRKIITVKDDLIFLRLDAKER